MARKLLTQWKQRTPTSRSEISSASDFAVAEVFSPPRFKVKAEKLGLKGLSFDVLQGWDHTKPSTQREVDRLLSRANPALLVVSFPCKYWGGWHRLNACYLSALERARLVREARRQAAYAVEQAHKQLQRGCKLLWEHPWSSDLWKHPPVAALLRKLGKERVNMCAYGLQCDGDANPMQKATGLMMSDPNMREACKRCPGTHVQQIVEGASRSGEPRSAIAGRYTPQFVRAFLHSALGTQEGLSECLCILPDEASESVSLKGLECLAGEDSQAAAEPNQSG